MIWAWCVKGLNSKSKNNATEKKKKTYITQLGPELLSRPPDPGYPPASLAGTALLQDERDQTFEQSGYFIYHEL